MAQNNTIDLEQLEHTFIINGQESNINNGQTFTRQTCDQVEHSFNYSSERTPLARTFSLFDCNDTNMDVEDPLQSRIERLENEQIRTETQINLLLEEIETLNHKLDIQKKRIPFPEGHFLEVQEISGVRYLVVCEPQDRLYPKNDNGPLTLDDLQCDTEENDDTNADDEYDGYISDDFKFYGERIRFLRNKNPKNDEETSEEYEDRINKLGEEWLASDNAKNEEDR